MGIRAIILLGAPGAGKGTIAEGISKHSDYIHFSTGDMLREAIQKGTPLGKLAEGYLAKGELVPDNVIIAAVMQRIELGPKEAKYLFDGFPRTLAQARELDKEFAARSAVLAKVFLLDVTREIAVQRLTGRRLCRKCGANFHVTNIPPKKNGVCDRCQGPLEQRSDDLESTIVSRLEVFHQQTAALIVYYKNRGILERIDSTRPREQTIAEVRKLLNG